MTYLELIDVLNHNKSDSFAAFQRRLIPTAYNILGVTTPTMRKIAKMYEKEWQDICAFPNEYYEVVFIKLTLLSKLPYETFIEHVDYAVSLMDNWAHCDCFKVDCIKHHKEAFLNVLARLFQRKSEYYQRYVLVCFLSYYIEKKYLPIIEEYIQRADTSKYYVHMAVAWLTAEILIKQYDDGLRLLNAHIMEQKTHNKAIQKAIESYRLTNEQKEFLRSLKIKTNKYKV